MDKAIVLMGLAAVLVFGVILWQEYDATRPARAAHEARMLRLEYEAQRDWQENQQPYFDMFMLSAAIVAITALLGFIIASFAAIGQRLYHWGQGRQRYHLEVLKSQERVLIAQAQYQHAQPPSHLHYAPHYSSRNDHALPVQSEEHAAPELPGVVDLADLAFQPSMQRVLLGVDTGGDLITVPVGRLCHVAISGYTGGGKSNLLRLLMPQLQAIGAKMVLCDPHYAPVDATSGDDWRPIVQRLHQPPAYTPAAIDEAFSWFVDELDRRLELRRQEQSIGSPLFLALDELPIIADSVKGAIDRLGRLLREGRKVHIFAMGSSQDFLIKTLGGSAAIRDAYRTAFYGGGDILSARSLLDMPQKDIDEGRLGGGIVYLRSSATTPARLVRVPYASNVAVRGLLADTAPTVTIEHDTVPENTAPPNGADYDTAKTGTPDTDAVHGIPDDTLIAELVRRGKSANEVYKVVGGSRGKVLQRVKELKEAMNPQQKEVGA